MWGLPTGVTWGWFEFSQPMWLLLALLVVPIVYVALTSRVVAGPWRRWTTLALRVALVLSLVLALAGTRMVWDNKGICVVFVLDQSQSIPTAMREAIRQRMATEIEKMDEDDRFVVIEFGGDAVLASLPSPKGPIPKPVQVKDAGRTDIARALRLAMASFPEDRQKRVVLISDGNQNAGDAIKEARVAAANGVDVDTLLMTADRGHEVIVEQLILPQRVQKGAQFAVRAIVSADRAQKVKLRILRDGVPMAPQEKMLKEGTNVFDIMDQLDEGGFHQYQVSVEPAGAEYDTFSANNTADGFTTVNAPGRVLVIRGKGNERDYISEALKDRNVAVDAESVAGLPMDVAGLLRYDCVVIENVGIQKLSNGQLNALERWVRDNGGGVVLVGGDDAFGPGGWKDTPLETVSPVEMDVKRKKHLATVAMVIVLDKSGSMGAPAGGGKMKMDLANQGAWETIKLLGPADEAQVGAVDTSVAWMTADHVVPLTGANKAALKKHTLSNMPGGGGIWTNTALTHAYRLVTSPKVSAMARHVVLFADTDDTEEQNGCIDMARKYLRHSPPVTLTVIGLGRKDPSNHSGFQEALAKAGGGRWHVTDDPMMLPKIFAKEAFIASRNAFVEKKEGIAPTLYTSPVLDGIDKGVPRVYGYVGTTLKPRATLAAHGLEVDDPLMAHWSIGLGKGVAYTSDATARWGKDWVNWEGFSKFWWQTVRWASKSVTDKPVMTTTRIDGKTGRVALEAFDKDGKPINNLQLRAVVNSPDQNEPSRNTQLVQVGPGRYEGEFEAGSLGTYTVTVVDQASGSQVDSSGAVLSYPPEFRDLQPNAAMLKSLAEITGGRELSSMAGVFEPKATPVKSFFPLWGALLLFAAIALIVDVAWRRLNISDWFRRELRPLPAMGSGAALGALKTIRTGKREVQAQRQTLKQRIEAQVEAAPSAPAAGPAGPAPAAAPAAARPAPSAEPQPAGEGYAGRLMSAKRRAADQIRDKGNT